MSVSHSAAAPNPASLEQAVFDALKSEYVHSFETARQSTPLESAESPIEIAYGEKFQSFFERSKILLDYIEHPEHITPTLLRVREHFHSLYQEYEQADPEHSKLKTFLLQQYWYALPLSAPEQKTQEHLDAIRSEQQCLQHLSSTSPQVLALLKSHIAKQLEHQKHFAKHLEHQYPEHKHLDAFFQSLPKHQQSVLQSHSLAQIAQSLKDLKLQYESTLKKMPPGLSSSLYELSSVYYGCGLQDIGSFLESHHQRLSLCTQSPMSRVQQFLDSSNRWLEDKLHSLFSSRSQIEPKSSLPLLEPTISQEFDAPRDLAQKTLIDLKAQQLCEKFNLRSITLSAVPPERQIQYLEFLDTTGTQVSQKLGITPSTLGIHGTLAIGSTDGAYGAGAAYTPGLQYINLPLYSHPSTLLHEWTHALDAHIQKSYVHDRLSTQMQHNYVSQMEESIIHDQRHPYYHAYQKMRRMTQELLSSNAAHAFEEKSQQLLQNTWSCVLQTPWSVLPKTTQEQLQSKESFQNLSQWIVHKSPEAQEYVNWKVRQHHPRSMSHEYAHNFVEQLHPQLQQQRASVFQQLEQNIIGNKSLYLTLSKSSNVASLIKDFLTHTFSTIGTLFTPPSTTAPKKSGYGADYFSRPQEMLARYVESQVYPEHTLAYNARSTKRLSLPYPMHKDAHFLNALHDIVSSVFTPQALTHFATPVIPTNQAPSLLSKLGLRRAQQSSAPLAESQTPKNMAL